MVGGDMMDPQSLVRAFAGAHGVFSVQNPMIDGLDAEVTQGRNVGSWESKAVVADHLRELGVPLTVLRPMAFMELMTDKSFYPAVSTWHLMPKLMGDRPVSWLCLDDHGAIAAQAFARPERFVGADLALASDLRSIEECKEIWRQATGRRPRRFPMPVWMFERFVGDDLPTMWRWLRTGDVPVDPELTRSMLLEAASVETWVGRVAGGRGQH